MSSAKLGTDPAASVVNILLLVTLVKEKSGNIGNDGNAKRKPEKIQSERIEDNK